MNDDIFKKLDEVGKADFHDAAWMRRQEDKLRAHIKTSLQPPARPPFPVHMLLAVGATALLIIGGMVLLAHRQTTQQHPAPTPLNSASPSMLRTPTPTAAPTGTPTPEPTPSHTKSPTATD